MKKKVSVIIRTYNEEKHIREVLEILTNQTYKNFEVLIIDSESTDNTLKIANEFINKINIKIFKIKKKDFDYSYSSNYGVNKSTGDYICFLSGHSVPVYNDYIQEIINTFSDKQVGGCYGDVIALEDGSIYEKMYNKLGIIKNYLKHGRKKDIVIERKIRKGILSCSNACIKKEILIKHPFAKQLGKNGGEDIEVAYRILEEGYVIAMNPKMLVKHSHGKNLKGFIKELKNWQKIYNEVLIYIENNK